MKKLLKAFFCSGDGDIQPVYIYIFILLSCVVTMMTMRLLQIGHFSDTLVLGTLGFVAAWAAIYNVGRNGVSK